MPELIDLMGLAVIADKKRIHYFHLLYYITGVSKPADIELRELSRYTYNYLQNLIIRGERRWTVTIGKTPIGIHRTCPPKEKTP